MLIFFFFSQDRKVHLNEWDGKTLKEIVVLEGNQNIVSALAFSPDGKLLASGDVSFVTKPEIEIDDGFLKLKFSLQGKSSCLMLKKER